MRAFCLSFHAHYRCAHSGACCTAGWPIQVEHGGMIALVPKTSDGACIHFGRDGDRLCAIQRDHGAGRMPTACRNFPRVTLRDSRGIFITLSHFCPTAARLLLTTGDIAIVDAPPSISLNGRSEGLDAREVMPPLLRSGMLLDLDGYTAWEQLAIEVFNDWRYSARQAAEIISAATLDASEWCPGVESLSSRVAGAFEGARAACSVDDAVPQRAYEHPLKAFLASHVFASWAAYQDGGLNAIVKAMRRAFDLVDREYRDDEAFIETIRSADLRLRHT